MNQPQLPRIFRAALLVAMVSVAAPTLAATQVLYDAADAPDLQYSPTTPGWLESLFFGVTETVTAQGTTLTAAGNGGYGGYSNHVSTISFPPLQVGTGALVNAAFPVLDRVNGYALDLGFRLADESHSGNDNRAGFSITLLGNDLKGIELGFQGDRIFAQETGPNFFTAAESTAVAPGSSLLSDYHLWHLAVSGSAYTLSQGSATVLTGALRDYSAYVGLGQDAYRTANFLFFGDNTSSARATTEIRYAAISTLAPVPEPQVWAQLLAGGLLLAGALRRARPPR